MMKNSKLSRLLMALSLTVASFFALSSADQSMINANYQPKAQIIQEKRELKLLSLILNLIIGLVAKAFFLLIKLFLKIAQGPLSILFDILTDTLIIFLMLLLVTGMIFRLLFPGRSLKELYTPRNLSLMAISSLLLSSVGNLGGYFADYRWLLKLIMTALEVLMCNYVLKRVAVFMPSKQRTKLLLSIVMINLITYLLNDLPIINAFLCISGVGVIIAITAYLIYVCYYK